MGLPSQDAQNQNLVYGTDLGNVQPRLEIDEMVTQQPDTLNLYLLALAELEVPKSFSAEKSKGGVDWFTFLQLSGVHGLPAVPWTGVDGRAGLKALKDIGGDKLEISEQPKSANPDREKGYCTHGSVLFPTWHRAYLLAYEQALYNKVVEIAARYTDASYKERYSKAAKLFRLPYWDPVMPRNETENANKNWFGMFGAPYVITAETVKVRTPAAPDNLTEVPNPLFQFSFYDPKTNYDRMAWPPPLDSKGEVRPSRTTRYPSMNPNSYAIDTNSVGVDKILQEQAAILARGFHRLFAVERKWFDFSNHAKADWSTFQDDTGLASPEVDPNISLESWHDNIHDITGGGGHMSDPSKAAFDPIFWMHHCNIDRMLAMYQTQESKIFVSDALSRAGSLAYGVGTHVGEKTPLVPFRKQAGDNGADYWNSTQVRDWTSLGYSYADTKPTPVEIDQPDDQKVALEKYIADRYAWITEYLPRPSGFAFPKNISQVEAIPDKWKKPRDTGVPPLTPNHPGDVYPGGAIIDGKITTWDLGVRVPKFAYKNTFNVHVFLGFLDSNVANNPRQWATSSTNCGFTTVFSNSSEETCTNCRKQKANLLIYEDVIPLTMILRRFLSNYQDGGSPPPNWRTLDGLTPTDALKDWLKNNLIVKVGNVVDNTEIPLDQAKAFGLKFQISQQEYTLPTTEHPLGVYGPTTSYPDLTGLRPGEFDFPV